MTLSTNVYVLDEVGPHELFRFCQTLLTKYDEEGRTWRQMRCSDKPRTAFSDEDRDQGQWRISNEIGQGLPAILDIRYRPGAPLYTPEQAAQCDRWCEDDCDKDHYERACWLDIDFDTAYGYRSAEGMGCGDLHAALVAQVGKWCDERQLRWEWRNEFTSEVHGGEDRYERLIDLCSGGFEAAAWFQHTVKPAIEAKVAAEGGEVQW